MLTPRELAEVIGVSESSLRRWVDSGGVRIVRTGGGHRRIPLAEAVRFIRQLGVPIARPELLGIDALAPATPIRPPHAITQSLYDVLHAGDLDAARGLILASYLQGQSLPAIFDGPIAQAMRQMGELWSHDRRGILIEHRATQICLEALIALRELIPTANQPAPLALGGGTQDDPYLLPTMMAATVLSSIGYHAVNLGANTPVELLAREAVSRRARLVWLSLSDPPDTQRLRQQLVELADALAARRIRLIIGGRRHLECFPPTSTNIVVGHSMQDLEDFAIRLRRSGSRARGQDAGR